MQPVFIGMLVGALFAAIFIILLQAKAIKMLGSRLEECKNMIGMSAAIIAKMAKKQGIEMPEAPSSGPANPIQII